MLLARVLHVIYSTLFPIFFVIYFFFAYKKIPLLGHLGILSYHRDDASLITREREISRQRRGAARVRSLSRAVGREIVYIYAYTYVRMRVCSSRLHTHRRFLGEGDRGRSSKVIHHFLSPPTFGLTELNPSNIERIFIT